MKTHQLLLLVPALLSSQVIAASLLNDFSSSAFPNESTDSQWSIGGGTYINSAPAGASTASFSLTGIRGSDFTMSTQFILSSTSVSPSSGVSTVGFGVFGLDSTFTGTAAGNAYYLVDFGYANGMGNPGIGRLRVSAQGDTSNVTSVNGSALDTGRPTNYAILKDVTYTLKLSGTYSGGTLNMVLGLYDAAGTTQIGTSATLVDTTPLAGDTFGYRNRSETAGNTEVSFDNFALQSIPEPSVFALALPAAALIVGRRKRVWL